jgi:hypothetical protein
VITLNVTTSAAIPIQVNRSPGSINNESRPVLKASFDLNNLKRIENHSSKEAAKNQVKPPEHNP